ncbi:MAG: hypothetical protein ACOC22_00535 [bacterium]
MERPRELENALLCDKHNHVFAFPDEQRIYCYLPNYEPCMYKSSLEKQNGMYRCLHLSPNILKIDTKENGK